MDIEEDVVLIAGPTASGKSALAIKLAQQFNGVVVNADSMQIYDGLRIVTARPSAEEESMCEHRLFGTVSPHEAYSVAKWLEDAEGHLKDILTSGRKVIFVGGTGLYFSAMLDGLSPMPPIDADIRKKWRDIYDAGGDDLHGELLNRDPEMAAKLKPLDRQRITRALEVYDSTGKSLLEWQDKAAHEALLGFVSTKKLLILPERSLLHERINARFHTMIENGAIEEVQSLLEMRVAGNLPVMKAIGVPQLSAYLRDEVSLDEAIQLAQAASRQYAKRQYTWFRNQFSDDWQDVSSS
ncbi:MAG: tRNA (adenosine(37)-N6)-dimethylallyltransferase MiaA [Hyphomicrobiales bacterium]|nr:MAG: tRNA (adenosine(37)-N6)-dimethylallyltransferase MiaA [Hyphomicrobiales bacterium]